MRPVPWSHVCIGVADSMSKNSRYLAKRAAGMSNTFVAIRKLTNMGFSTWYRKSPESPARFRTVPMLT